MFAWRLEFQCVNLPYLRIPFSKPAWRNRQATGRFFTMYEGLAMVRLPARVLISWYRLESNTVPVASVKPDMVSIVPLEGCELDADLWQTRRRAVPRHPPRPVQRGDSVSPERGDGQPADDLGADVSEASDSSDEAMDLEAGLRAILEGAELLAESGFDASVAAGAEAAPEEAAAAESPAGDAVVEHSPMPPPPEAPPAADGPGEAVRRRRGAEVTFYVEGGSISYYASKNAFEAVCENKAHGRCVLTRTCRQKGTTADGFPRGGRPVGLLAAWLSYSAGCATKDDHWEAARLRPPHALRADMRRLILGTPSGVQLAGFERAVVPGETPEPVSLDAYK